jgi:hypothetical protein
MSRTPFLEAMISRTHTRQLAVERYITLLEPQTLDDTLTLAILLESHLGLHLDDYAQAPQPTPDDATGIAAAHYREEHERISDLVEKIVRGLTRVAKSPLEPASAYPSISFDDKFSVALAQAKRLGVEAANA